MSNTLLRCPFCDGRATVKTRYIGYGSIGLGEHDEYRVACKECRASSDEYRHEAEAIAAWNRRALPEITGETSDGYHTFNELYHHRAVLFSVVCNSRPDMAWKSRLHHDGTMYDGMFIVGINTPDGQATYHYDVEPYWGLFRVPELSQAPKWDGHTPAQAIERIGRLTQPENKPLTLDELRQMDGEPVYIVDEDLWGIIKCDLVGRWAGMPFAVGHYSGVNFEWDIKKRGLVCCRSKPKEEHHEDD